MKRLGSGIYLARTNKPYALFGLPIIGRHNGYCGQSNAYALRWPQHTHGGGKFKSVAKDWSDLDPEFHRILPLPLWLFNHAPKVVDALEAVCIFLTAPVYNVDLNKLNLRRIPKERAARQRRWRNTAPFSIRSGILLIRLLAKLLLLGVLLLILQKGQLI